MNYIALIFGLMLFNRPDGCGGNGDSQTAASLSLLSWLGLAMIVFVSIRMIVEGSMEVAHKFL